MAMFWTVLLILVAIGVVVVSGVAGYDSLLRSKERRANEERSRRILEEQRIERQNRDFLAGHESGLYGDFIPIDPETGAPIEISRPERQKLTAKDFQKRFRSH
ncbi:hypothetical protein GS534_00810 [Rhodococcus hoagii]|nr:hypothetical protein [Prescottella equi]